MKLFLALVLQFFAIFSAVHAAESDAMGEYGAFAALAGASQQTLFTITNDRDSAVSAFRLLISENNLAAGVLYGPSSEMPNAAGARSFPMHDVEKTEGVALIDEQGHKVLFLQGQLDRATQEGRFHLKFLANGLQNTYKTCDFLLRKSGAKWLVKNAYTGNTVMNMKIITWSLGLTTLQGICP